MKLILLSILSLFCLTIQAKKITEEDIKNFCRDANQAVIALSDDNAKTAAFQSEAAKWFKPADLEQITPQQVDFFFETGGVNLDRYLRHWFEPTLTAKATKDTAFAFLSWKYMPENDGFMHTPKETEALMRFLNASDLQSQLDQHPEYAQEVFAALGTMKDANWNTSGFPQSIERLMQCQLSELAVLDCVKAFNSIARVDDMPREHTENIRKACVAQYERLIQSLDNARKQKMCQENIKYLNGPFACGTLVGSTAPEIHILRAFKDNGDSIATVSISSLKDLEGKVVLIDFWGTKCVPCIQSFPEVAELQKQFEGKDVVILGITSLQGYFVDTPNHRTIQCRNNPEKELGCFPAYMKGMGINWTIAITEEDVMNTDFGVLAIPHVTIIDKQGKVRYNAVNLDNEAKAQLLNTLLAE